MGCYEYDIFKELRRIADALEAKNEIDKKTLSYIKATNEMGKENLEMHKEIFVLDKKIREYSVQKIASEINNRSADNFSKDVEDVAKKEGELSETELRLLMQHPKYWRDQDPEMVERVERGFKRLFGEKK